MTHESFDAYVRRAIWTPLKMNATSYSLAGLSPDHLAVGYGAERKADGTFSFVPARVFWGHQSASGTITDHQYSYPDYPIGRTYTNARDFARLILMFLNAGTVDGARILSPSSVDMIFTPSGYRNLDGWKQGIGVNGPLDLRGRQVWGHDGQGEGSVSALYVNRETGVGAFTIANSNYLDESQNYSLVDLDMHLMAWFEDSAIDRVAANYIPAPEKGTGHAPLAAAMQEADHSRKANQRAAQRFSSQQEKVWKEEQNYFRYLQAKDLQGFMSLWDENFLGWPDYSEVPLQKKDIESGAAAEFQNVQQSARLLPAPKPEAIGVFGDVAVTHYFWPEADDTSSGKYRITHTWRKGPDGWRIISGMDCEVPRSAQSTPLASATSNYQEPPTKTDDKGAVEATVRAYEEAVQVFDFARADSLLARNAKWIERSAPEDAAFGAGTGFWAEAKANKIRVRNEPRDFDIHLQGQMAWVTLLVDVTMVADNERARALLARSETEETGKTSEPDQREWRATYTESEVLVRTPNGWRIALGHTSRLPTEPDLQPTSTPQSVEAKVLELDRAWGQAYVKSDIDVIDRTLAPDWRGWLDTGGSDKATELAEFKEGKNRSLENVIDNTRVRVYGNTAVVEARERVRFRDKAGEHWFTWHITDVFVNQVGQWQVVASHGSTIPNP